MNSRADANEEGESAAAETNPLRESAPLGSAAYDPLIDRLVSGDLAEAQRRGLLAWLDEQPDRWRRCGLAFLEAQLWQEAMSAAMPRVSMGIHQSVASQTGPRRPWPTVRAIAAVAAAMLVSFTLGLCSSPIGQWLDSPGVVHATHDGAGSVPNREAVDGPRPAPRTRQAASQFPPPEGRSADARSQASSGKGSGSLPSPPVQTFAVLKVATNRSDTRDVHVPVLEGPSSYEKWLRPEPEAIPEHVRRELERKGYQLEQRRRFLEVQLEDGRHALIPIDQYEVTFVGSRSS
jgi:hypothetical protein